MQARKLLPTVGIVALCAGCVDRKFVIESNVPNAQVFIDNKHVGAAPAYAPFEYYGYHTITLVHPEYETVVNRVKVPAPWYAYPPIDFVAEALWPFPIRDTRRYTFEMQRATPARPDDILAAAEALRVKGQTLPPAERPAEPRPRNPRVDPLPPAAPLVPSVGPASGPLPPGTVPSVAPGYRSAADN